jgi:hypothetical protein
VLPTGGVSMLAWAIKNNYLLSWKPFKSTNARILYWISWFGWAFMRWLIFPQLYNEFNLEWVIDNVIFHPFEGLDYIWSKVKTYLPAIVSKVIAATAMNTYYWKYELPYIYKTIRWPNQQSSESVDQ